MDTTGVSTASKPGCITSFTGVVQTATASFPMMNLFVGGLKGNHERNSHVALLQVRENATERLS
jgi:hypothetical protein